MSEPIRTSAEKREKLAQALKRNMARRKTAGHHSPVASEARAETSAASNPAFGLISEALAQGDGASCHREHLTVGMARPEGRASHQPAVRRSMAFSVENAGSD